MSTNQANKGEEFQPDFPLKVAALSLNIAVGNPEENRRRTEEMLRCLPADTDVAVLPELFTTSFMRDAEALLPHAEFRDGPTFRFLAEQARSHNILLMGSYLAKESNSSLSAKELNSSLIKESNPSIRSAHNKELQYFNRGFMVFPDGTHEFYDKHHLFCLSPEARLITHGHKRPPVREFRGWNISMIICYELRFPVWARNVDMKADLVAVPANWPDARGYAWRQLLIARAIENQVVMIGADRSGADDYGTYTHLSLIADELGRQIAPPLSTPPEGCPPPSIHGEEIPTPYGSILTATLSLANLRRLRKFLPTVCDADLFTIHPKDSDPS